MLGDVKTEPNIFLQLSNKYDIRCQEDLWMFYYSFQAIL